MYDSRGGNGRPHLTIVGFLLVNEEAAEGNQLLEHKPFLVLRYD